MKCLDQTLPCAGQLSSYTLTEDLHLYPESLNPTFAEIGIATSKSSIYHPTGNGQVECCNGIIWKGVCLALKSHGLPDSQWEMVPPDVLHVHSIRSLLSTATNTTPHETGFLLGIFFGGGQNLLLCKFLLLCYWFWTKFQGGAKVFRGANCLRGCPLPPPPPWKKASERFFSFNVILPREHLCLLG